MIAKTKKPRFFPRGYMTLDGGVFLWKTLAGDEYNSFDLNV